MNNKAIATAVAIGALALAGAANAANLLTDNFDTEAGGGTSLNYAGYANWNVTSGTVDQIHSGGFGINCVGGTGGCVDLDGSTGQGGTMTTKSSFAFSAGDHVTFDAMISGNQRGGNGDAFFLAFTFGGNTLLSSYSTGGGFGTATPFTNITSSGVQTSTGNNPFDPFTLYEISFVAGQAGTFNALVGTFSNDNVGPILDNVSISRTGAAPEPTTWAVMLTGFAGLGGMLRRRRSLSAA